MNDHVRDSPRSSHHCALGDKLNLMVRAPIPAHASPRCTAVTSRTHHGRPARTRTPRRPPGSPRATRRPTSVSWAMRRSSGDPRSWNRGARDMAITFEYEGGFKDGCRISSESKDPSEAQTVRQDYFL